MTKECESCTKCCEGWLIADIHGHKMFPGNPCFFLEQDLGCREYENRPEDPCKIFNCGWKEIPDMPDEFKPEMSGVIMHYKPDDNCWVLSKAPNNPSVQLLSWAMLFILSNGYNFVWNIDDKRWWIGSEEFCATMNKSNNVR